MIARDKVAHFIAGFFVYVIGALVAFLLSISLHVWQLLILVLIAAIGKELWDKLNDNDAELADVAATLAGGIAAMVVEWVIEQF